jgi:hypothetical protein
LKPGGDYWDTAFLRTALESVKRRNQQAVLDQIVIGAYANAGSKPLQFGAGGPERWPNARPYHTPPGVEDQRGFRIFDWYSPIIQATLQKPRPLFLFGLGSSLEAGDLERRDLNIARLLAQKEVPGLESIPGDVIGGAFYLLDQDAYPGWFTKDGKPKPIVEAYHRWAGIQPKTGPSKSKRNTIITHYLLLPTYDWGVTDYHLDIIRPFIKKFQPTIGFSLTEAYNAKHVTVLGGEHAFTEESLNKLRAVGVTVERINDLGTDIASFMRSQNEKLMSGDKI